MDYSDNTEIITTVQKKLCELGFYSGNADGHLNDLTAVAIIRYKRATGIFPNNMLVDKALLDMLKIKIEKD